MGSSLTESRYHKTRFRYDQRAEVVWQTLCSDFFQPMIKPEFHVLELGAGYGHFINHDPEVSGHIDSVDNPRFLADRSINFVLANNLFEQLTQQSLAATLNEVKRKLRPGVTLNILQPNYRLAYREYFDDYTHVAVCSERSLADFVEAHGFRVTQCVPGLLPFSIQTSKSPVRPWAIRAYLRLPWKPFAKQMFLRAVADISG